MAQRSTVSPRFDYGSWADFELWAAEIRNATAPSSDTTYHRWQAEIGRFAVSLSYAYRLSCLGFTVSAS